MKEVYVLRHANWNGKEDALTEQGKNAAENLSVTLPNFSIVCSSPFIRTQQTANILGGGVKMRIEAAASVPQSPPQVRQQILARRDTHPLGIAGVLFETKEAHPALELAGRALSQLIQQIFSDLQENQKALIISHDGTMVATERVLVNEAISRPLKQTYGELEGFIVDENLRLRRHLV